MPTLVHEILQNGSPATALLTFAAGDRTYSRVELRERAAATAAALSELGVSRGDRVAVMLGNRIEYVDLIFACSMLGAVVVHLHGSAKGPMLERALRGTEPRYTITLGSNTSPFDEVDADRFTRVVDVEMFVELGRSKQADGLESGATWRDPICIYSSSGTTGPAKGVTLPHQALFEMAATAQIVMGFQSDDVVYAVTPLFHANAFVFMFMSAAIAGAHTVIAERFSASSFWDDVERFGATKTSLVGTAASLLFNRSDDNFPGTTLELAAAVPRPRAAAAFEERFGVTLTEFYGSTEANLPLGIPFGERREGTCGRLLEGWECKIVDEDGIETETDVPGQLLVRPKRPGTVAIGYWGEPEKTVELWQDLWIHTGDVMRRDEDGWFHFVDRLKDAIRVSGENVASADIESVIVSFHGVIEAAAFGVPSDMGDQDIMVAVVLRDGTAPDWQQLREYCANALPYFAVPRYYEQLDALPRTPTERIKKADLRSRGVASTTADLGRPRRST